MAQYLPAIILIPHLIDFPRLAPLDPRYVTRGLVNTQNIPCTRCQGKLSKMILLSKFGHIIDWQSCFFLQNLLALCLDLYNVGILHCEKVAPLFQIVIHQRIAMLMPLLSSLIWSNYPLFDIVPQLFNRRLTLYLAFIKARFFFARLFCNKRKLMVIDLFTKWPPVYVCVGWIILWW